MRRRVFRTRVVYIASMHKPHVYHFDIACPSLRTGYRAVRLRPDGRIAVGSRETMHLAPCARCVTEDGS